MTPEQKIKWAAMKIDADWQKEVLPHFDESNFDDLWDNFVEKDLQWDALSEIRPGEFETDIPSKEWSRHYEQKEVAAKMPDGSYVGWTYWYGGGKHGEPESIDWMCDAYNVKCIEEKMVVVVRTFSKEV